MSFYLLERDAPAHSPPAPIMALAQQHGFTPLKAEQIGPWRLSLCHGLGPTTLVRINPAPDTTLIAIGTFFYQGHAGSSALRLYYDAWEKNGPGWQDTQGHFTLILIEHETIRLLCDGLGAHKIYHDPQNRCYSNSFLAILSGMKNPRYDSLGVYEYVFAGAQYGGRSFIEDLGFFPANHLLELGDTVSLTALPPPTAPEDIPRTISLNEAVQYCLAPLRETISRLVSGANGQFRLSFSGGYDSRMLLALLMEAGAKPELYVYGPDHDLDVQIAHKVADTEGLTIRQVDKQSVKTPAPEDMPHILEQSLLTFDGWKNTGLFDNGSDVPDRRTRHESGYLPLNGGLGEIYRNFFNIHDKAYRSRDIVNAFYRMYSPHWVSDIFDDKAYLTNMAKAMDRQIDSGNDLLNSRQAQMLYPLFRGRFWTAREAEINQRFGSMAFPYLEHSLIRTAGGIPLPLKNNGRLQATMICTISPSLASLPTSYGFPFNQPPNLSNRLDSLKSRLRPTRLRHLLWNLAHRDQRPFATELCERHLKAVINPDMPIMRHYFRIEALDDEDCFNRIATLEYLGERFGIALH